MDALSDCLSALATDPRYTRAYMKKADVLTAVGDYEGVSGTCTARHIYKGYTDQDISSSSLSAMGC